MGTREDLEGLRELVQFFRWRRAAEILGTCVVLALLEGGNMDAAGDRIKEAPPSDSTRARLRSDMRQFRKYLEGKGKAHLLDEDQDEVKTVGRWAGSA